MREYSLNTKRKEKLEEKGKKVRENLKNLKECRKFSKRQESPQRHVKELIYETNESPKSDNYLSTQKKGNVKIRKLRVNDRDILSQTGEIEHMDLLCYLLKSLQLLSKSRIILLENLKYYSRKPFIVFIMKRNKTVKFPL